ncbi:putative RNA-directed DNA polymerase, eukaryota, reverse transcriptase zinc-binding domain protein, partial [Tanacetum coccineum]
KGIKKEFSAARTPQQNGVAKRRNMTLIEAARTIETDNSTQDVNTAGTSINTASKNVNTGSLNINIVSPTVTTAPLEATHADFCLFPIPGRAQKGHPSIKRSKPDRSYARRASAVQVITGMDLGGFITWKKSHWLLGIEAIIRLFLAYASFKDFVVYQMDVKSTFLYGKIEKEVYFWETATARTLDNGEIELTATIDGKVKIVTEASVRRHLQLADSDGISSLPNTEIFEQLSLMGAQLFREDVSTAEEDISTAMPVSTAGTSMPVTIKCPIYNNDDVTPRAGNEDVSFSTDQVKDNHIVTHKDMVADEVVSDNSKPPSFENFIKENLRLTSGIVRSESERFGSTFSCGDVTIFNSFIHGFGLIDLPIGDFEDIVKEKRVAISDLEQSKPLHTKLKDLKPYLKLWHAHTKEVEANRKNCILATLRDLDKKIDDGHATDVDRTTRINRMQELEDLEKLESMDLVQKSRVKWEAEEDENSKFFHSLINSRKKSQMVKGIMLDGVWNSEPKDIKSAFLNFYKDKFSCHDSSVSFPLMLPAHCLSIADRDFLESMVSMDEIKAAVWDCGSQKASGPDDYRPISLIGIHYKIVAKILANRLYKSLVPSNMLLLHGEKSLIALLFLVILLIGTRNVKMMLFKVDFEKAFDSVSWRYLDYVLDKLGFGIKWCNWIKVGLASAGTSIVINRSPTSEFSLKIGLRQGDPLSPFLFIIVMEGLHMALNDGLAANMFHGVKVGSPGMHLSHLFYANDVIILSEWNLNAMENIIRILNIFYIASGLKINIHKSNVYGVWVLSNEKPLIDRFKARLSGWKANLLSIGGLLTLIKSSSEESKKLAWVKWSNIIASLDKVGLCVGSFKAFNILEPEELVDSDTCIWILSHDDKFSMNSVRKHIDELSLPSLSPST